MARISKSIVYIASYNFTTIFQYGSIDAVSPSKCSRSQFEEDFLRQQHHGEEKEEASLKLIYYGSCLAFETFSVILDQISNKHVYPVVHAYPAFVWSMARNDTTGHIDGLVPWQKVTTFLNKMDHNNIDFNVIECDEFPVMGGACIIEDLLIDGYI